MTGGNKRGGEGKHANMGARKPALHRRALPDQRHHHHGPAGRAAGACTRTYRECQRENGIKFSQYASRKQRHKA